MPQTKWILRNYIKFKREILYILSLRLRGAVSPTSAPFYSYASLFTFSSQNYRIVLGKKYAFQELNEYFAHQMNTPIYISDYLNDNNFSWIRFRWLL